MFLSNGIRVVAAGFLIGASLVSGGWAAAAYTRSSAAACGQITSDFLWSGGTLVFNGAGTFGYLRCSVPDSDTHPHENASAAVYGKNSSGGSLSAAACVQYYNTAGGYCGTTASSSTVSNNVSLNPDTSGPWANYPSDFPYLYITMKNSQLTGLYGYATTY